MTGEETIDDRRCDRIIDEALNGALFGELISGR
jgi:hypothetical protein